MLLAMKQNLIIIGAGLSGIYTAKLLEPYYTITILEARHNAGGRIRTIDGFDMGPSWVWQHQKNILNLIEYLKLELFSQHTKGLAVYDTPKGADHFNPQAQPPSARLKGGLGQLIQKLLTSLENSTIHYQHKVQKISYEKDGVNVKTQDKSFSATHVILACAPRIALDIEFSPKLHQHIVSQLEQTPTWMAHTAKCVITYKEPFWRRAGLSGFGFSNLGPLSEIHDSSTEDKAALFGFFHSKAKVDKDHIIAQLVRMFGPKAEEFLEFHLIDWRVEPFASSPLDGQALHSHPNYGYDLTDYEDHLIFTGSESAMQEGGYLEGALIAAMATAAKLKARL